MSRRSRGRRGSWSSVRSQVCARQPCSRSSGAPRAASRRRTRLEAAHSEAQQLGLECVVSVRDEEELELALLRLDPEILLLSGATRDEGADAIDRVLELLPDVPAGKLAIADVAASTRDDVLALERAGVDAVLVGGGNVAELVGGAPPEV